MAKKVNLDEDFDPEEEVIEEVEDVDAVDEVEEAVADEPAEKIKPRGKNTTLTLVLCILNVAAALGFVVLLLLDYQKRQDWSYVVFMNELQVLGLPLKEESDGISASRASGARQNLSSKQISEVLSQRGGKGGGEFRVVDEPFPNRITPQSLTPAILKDYFGSQGVPVATLEDEIKRLRDKVPVEIANVAKTTTGALKDESAKRKFAAKLLLSLAFDVQQVEALDKIVKAAKGQALDDLIEDAVQRRLLIDILAPCEVFRPGAVGTPLNEKIADLDNFKLDQLKSLLQKRFDVTIADKFDGDVHLSKDWDLEKRISIEKRATIGFLLVTIANLHKPEPDPKQPDRILFVPLYPEGGSGTPNLLRAQTVLGLYEFAVALQNLPVAWQVLEERVAQAIQVDRQGFDIIYKDQKGEFKEFDNKPARNQAFIDKHAAEIKGLRDLALEIRRAEKRLEDLQEQNKTAKNIYEFRDEHLKEMMKKLIEARMETAKQVAELRDLQNQIFQAQTVLSDAQEKNIRLEQAIKAEENKARGKVATP